MSERTTNYPTGPESRTWKPLSPDMAAGYERDALGDLALVGLMIYGPTTDKLRGTRLRDLERPQVIVNGIRQEAPPTPEQIAVAWGRTQEVHELFARGRKKAQAELDAATQAEELQRRDGEDPDDFYQRIARAHRILSATTRRPTAELARRAGVPAGTAAAWVSRARARGWIKDGVEHS